MSSGLMSQSSDMLANFQFRLTNSSLSVDLKVPGQSVIHTESPSIRHPVSTEYQRLRFQGGVVDPVPPGSGLAQSTGGGLARPVLGADAAHSRDLLSEDCGTAQPPLASVGPRVSFAHPLDSGIAHDTEDNNNDNRYLCGSRRIGIRMIKSLYFLFLWIKLLIIVVFIYNCIKILVLILILRFTSVVSSSLFCVFGDHPHHGDLSLGCRRYLISALHPLASTEALEATQAALTSQAAQATQSACCHSSRLCVASGRQPSMNALIP